MSNGTKTKSSIFAKKAANKGQYLALTVSISLNQQLATSKILFLDQFFLQPPETIKTPK
jgi:hypothetical protein